MWARDVRAMDKSFVDAADVVAGSFLSNLPRIVI
jgi:hypothetical protein